MDMQALWNGGSQWFLALPKTLWVLAFVLSVLIVATAYVGTVHLVRPKKDIDELEARVDTWWVIVALVTVAFWGGQYWYAAPFVLFGFISFIALKEFFTMVPLRHEDRTPMFIAYLFIPLQYYFAAVLDHHGLFMMSIIVYGVAMVAIVMVLKQKVDGFMVAFATLLTGMMITTYSISHLAHFFALPASPKVPQGAIGLVLFYIVLTQGNDVAQYLSGKLFGRHKIVPVVSPNKTWEGFVGGAIITTALGVFLAPILTPFSWYTAFGVSSLIATLGFFGDVFISALKRDLGIKDTSKFLPGHGGMLDRVDSFTLSAPIYFHVVNYFVYMKGGLVCSAVSCG
jgi:phosphatidate cytidylyltransferase